MKVSIDMHDHTRDTPVPHSNINSNSLVVPSTLKMASSLSPLKTDGSKSDVFVHVSTPAPMTPMSPPSQFAETPL